MALFRLGEDRDGPYQRRTGGCGGGELLQRTVVDAACRLARRQPPADAVGWLPASATRPPLSLTLLACLT
jgi:hypothetical protein